MDTLNKAIKSDLAPYEEANVNNISEISSLRNVLEVDYNRNMTKSQLRLINVKSRLFLKYFKIDALNLNGADHG